MALVSSTVWAVFVLSARAADTTYVVKRNDTLFGIARQHGVSVVALAERNDISKNYHVRTGQRLFIPSDQHPSAKAAKQPAAVSADLPKSVSEAIQVAPVRKGRWKYIVVHHSGVDEGTVKGMDRYHRDVRHMENGLAYHFVIGNGNGMRDGEIAVASRWSKQLDGGHLASVSQNKIAIGICLVGNFDKAEPSPSQMKSLTALVKALMKRTALSPSEVRTHRQINVVGTRCPGSKFPTKSFVAGLKK